MVNVAVSACTLRADFVSGRRVEGGCNTTMEGVGRQCDGGGTAVREVRWSTLVVADRGSSGNSGHVWVAEGAFHRRG